MATEEIPKEKLEEKLGDLNLEEPEKGEEAPEEQKEAVLEELVDHPPHLHHVETADTTDPVSEPPSTEDGVVKSEVPEAFSEELKGDHDIVPPTEEEKPTEKVGTVAKETGADDGETAPATRDVPVEVTHEDVDEKKPSKLSALGGKISEKFHKITGKD
jgi:hypothetical protein